MVEDDSVESQSKVRAVLEKHARSYPGTIYLLDEQFRRKLCEKVSTKHDSEVLNAIKIKSDHLDCYGSNRNTILPGLSRACNNYD